MLTKLILRIALCTLAQSAGASHIIRLDIDRKDDIYEISVEMTVDAPAESIRAVLTDFENLDRLNKSITGSEIIASGAGDGVRVLTRLENCVLFFCVDMHKVEDVTEDEQGRIHVAIVPDQSSFRSGHASWEIQDTGNGSRIIHHARMEPDIRVPALVGETILMSTLRKAVLESLTRLDCLSRAQCETAEQSDTAADEYRLYEM